MNNEFVNNIELAAENGDCEAMAILSTSYANGSNQFEKDDVKSIYWLKKAAELNDGWSAFNLGLRYENGNGLSKDGAKALALFKQANSIDSCYAGQKLGFIYENGVCGDYVVGIDMNTAFGYWLNSAEQGDFWSKIHLARIYERGAGIDQNIERSAFWYDSAQEQFVDLEGALSVNEIGKLANDGFTPAIELLVRAYKFGEFDFDKDDNKSKYWSARLTAKS